MQIEIVEVKDPVYASADGTAINLQVKFKHLKDFVGFTATPSDDAEHGRALFAKAKSGAYGTVGLYVPPPAKTPTPTEGATSEQHDQT